MINKIKLIIVITFLTFLSFVSILKAEEFNFDVTEIEILDEGNLFKGLKRGTITTNDGLIITADEFEYNKLLNLLNAQGNVEIEDEVDDYKIFTKKITYLKNKEKIFTKGKTKAIIESKYNFESENIIFLRNEKKLISSNKSSILENDFTLYELDKFEYLLEKKILKGVNVEITTNLNQPVIDRDKYNFKDGIFDLLKKNFTASDTKINLKKNTYENPNNDPRVYSVSSKKEGNITILNKAIFTSCGKNDKCPPWSIKAKKIIHDSNKKQLIYDQSIIRIYDVPIFYFPKFFHPDPSVERQSGFLQPRINSSNVLGSSLNIPYYHVISDNKDFTFKPTIFDSNIYMFQNEYRQKNKKSSLITDFGFTKGYSSSVQEGKKNNLGHFFSKFDIDFDLSSFIKSRFEISVEKVSLDTYLKIFDANLTDIDPSIKPENQDKLVSNMILELDSDDYSMDMGMTSYETLSGTSSDRYQFILPYYNYNKKKLLNNNYGSFNFSSKGSNNLKDTNNVRTSVINNFGFKTFDYISEIGIQNNLGFHFKNLNTSAKNDPVYKSSAQIELMNIINYEASFPLIKSDNKYFNKLTPKLSLRANPSDMKNYSSSDREINTSNIFSINRLGLDDSLEEGESLTLGIDFRKETLEDMNKFFEFNLATILREKEENGIPISSTINKKSSNLFGSSNMNLSENFEINYDFATDNDFETFEYNSIGTKITLNKLVTSFDFMEKTGKMGDTNFLENETTFNFNDNNYITFNTRRNRKINLTEYYDLVYEYKNDCLTAGIKYKKTYYEDREVKPSEDLFFTITLFPITQYEQKVDQALYRD